MSNKTTAAAWRFWIDRGGTFTDVVACDPAGRLHAMKLLSEDPARYRDAAAEGIRRTLRAHAGQPAAVAEIRMGTTVATNALLERTGEPTVLVTTRGFADALRIGYQNRPDIFACDIVRPAPLHARVIEANERLAADGTVVTALDTAQLADDLAASFDLGLRSVAIVFMHGYRFSSHEEIAAGIARDAGFTQVSTSHEVMPLMKLVSRGDTTVADAWLSPLIRRYLAGFLKDIESHAPNAAVRIMQSSGRLASADTYRGRDSVLSGPAGGIVGMARTGAMAGIDRMIGFDMGGTSTDVSLYQGRYLRTQSAEISGVRLRAPMMDIHTVAAGGGSVLRYTAGRFLVGPQSAGADPGPACYGKGGPVTVTDANVCLGKIQAWAFPQVFGRDGASAIETETACGHFDALADAVRADGGDAGYSGMDAAEGFIEVAVDRMAQAIRKVSLQRGHDASEHTLACFGGAAGQHACLVADALGMKQVFIHPLAGVLSAYGMGLASMGTLRFRTLEVPLTSGGVAQLGTALADLEAEATAELVRQGVPDAALVTARTVQLKYAGTDTALEVTAGNAEQMRTAFNEAHRRQYGFVEDDRTLLIESAVVEVTGGHADLDEPQVPLATGPLPSPLRTVPVRMAGVTAATPVFDGSALQPGQQLDGPAIIVDANATVVVEPGWHARLSARRHLLLVRRGAASAASAGTDADPVRLELFNNLFMHIAEQMGTMLARTASSVNIKERLDFSCALFDARANLIANAPHMPVHLGSMGESVAAILNARQQQMRPGDVFMLNAPYNGGTHLPDITVVTPVFDRAGGQVRYFCASRGHHADLGGTTPGSMPAHSQHIEEEGVLFDNVRLVHRGVFDEAGLRRRLQECPYPARNPDQNVADLRAQVAANATGVRELERVVNHYGAEVVDAYMQHVQDNAEALVRSVITSLQSGHFTLDLDNGQRINVAIDVDHEKGEAVIDFTGTSPQANNNFNAPAAVCRAAVLYVFRTLVSADIPMNAGCMRPLRLVVPPGCMLSPHYPAAVVAGNVETSQCITDALYGALGKLAASQGTMNNLTFGNERHQYYETICGGAGAGPDFDGADAVQTHMTNSRLTDPEVLEWRYPVRVESFAIRHGSGGAGRHRGGDGVERVLRFTEPVSVSLLANRHRVPPFGLEGGQPGATGEAMVIREDGSVERLDSTASAQLQAGDVLVVRTPGGGGFGKPPSSSRPGG